MAYEFKAIRRVEFAETDMAGIVHYSNFFRYMETAEHGFFRSLGLSVVMDQFDPRGRQPPRIEREGGQMAQPGDLAAIARRRVVAHACDRTVRL